VTPSLLASTLFGAPVAVDGKRERLNDLGVVKAEESWRIVAVRTKRRDAALTSWSPDIIEATATGDIAGAIWLREALFDRQIVDLQGRRVIRVGDVVLRAFGDALEVEAVEVGAAAVLRRLGLVRLAARFEPQLLPINRLHVPGEAAGALLLDAPRAQLEEMESETVTGLLSRLPVPVAEQATRTSKHRHAVARHARLRRRHRGYPRTPR
jgi:hypothetical protein